MIYEELCDDIYIDSLGASIARDSDRCQGESEMGVRLSIPFFWMMDDS